MDRLRSNLGTADRRRNMPESYCLGCSQIVLNTSPIAACGGFWHVECFTCQGCSIKLIGEEFHDDDGRPYCVACYQKDFCPVCAGCNEKILDKCAVALGRAWHPEHFCCVRCNLCIDSSVPLMSVNEQPFCQQCYLEEFGLRCAGCNKNINGPFLTALNKNWHRQCFVCSRCGIQLNGKSHYEHLGMPVCELDYAKLTERICCECEAPILDRCVNAMRKRYHENCFKCTYCQKPLRTGIFKEKWGKQYCHQCYGRLFG